MSRIFRIHEDAMENIYAIWAGHAETRNFEKEHDNSRRMAGALWKFICQHSHYAWFHRFGCCGANSCSHYSDAQVRACWTKYKIGEKEVRFLETLYKLCEYVYDRGELPKELQPRLAKPRIVVALEEIE